MSEEILIETSARHIHLCEEHIHVLFGEGSTLTVKKVLSQPDQFACVERVTVKGPKRSLENVSILGPARSKTQIELSATDCRTTGIPVVIRESGDIAGSSGCTLVGPCGELEITEGVIVAKRHIHMTKADAVKFDVSDKQIVKVKTNSKARNLTFSDVVVRVNDTYHLSMHIDTDESNAAYGVTAGTIVL